MKSISVCFCAFSLICLRTIASSQSSWGTYGFNAENPSADASGSGHDLVLPTNGVACVDGRLSLSGHRDWIVTKDGLPDDVAAFTIEMFVRFGEQTDESAPNEGLFHVGRWGSGARGTPQIEYNAVKDRLSARISMTPYADRNPYATAVVEGLRRDGREWHHVACVWDESKVGSESLKLYLDGIAAKTVSTSTNACPKIKKQALMFGGGKKRISMEFPELVCFHGEIADVRVTAAALTPADFLVAPSIPISSVSAGAKVAKAGLGVLDWDEASSWVDGKRPVEGDEVVIPEGARFRLYSGTPALKRVTVAGSLQLFGRTAELKAGQIDVRPTGQILKHRRDLVQKFTVEYATAEQAASARPVLARMPKGTSVAFTTRWDDTLENGVNVAAALKRAGVSGTFYHIGCNTNLEKRLLETSDRMRIGSHTVHHWPVGGLPANAALGETLANRIQLETASQSPVHSFVLPCCVYWDAFWSRTGAKWCGENLLRTGFTSSPEFKAEELRGKWYGMKQDEYVVSYLFEANDAVCDPKKFSAGIAEGLMQLGSHRLVEPILTLGVHPYLTEQGRLNLVSNVESIRGLTNWWFCTQDEYSAYRISERRARIERVMVEGTKATYRLARPDPALLGESVPLTVVLPSGAMRYDGRPAAGEVVLPCPRGHVPTAFDVVPARRFAGIDATLSVDDNANTATVEIANRSAEPLDDAWVVLRLPLHWTDNVSFEDPFSVPAGSTWRRTVNLPRKAREYERQVGTIYSAAQIDFVQGGVRKRLYAENSYELKATGDGRSPASMARLCGPFLTLGEDEVCAWLKTISARPGEKLPPIEGRAWRSPAYIGPFVSQVFASYPKDLVASLPKTTNALCSAFSWDFIASADGEYTFNHNALPNRMSHAFVDGVPVDFKNANLRLTAGAHRLCGYYESGPKGRNLMFNIYPKGGCPRTGE